MENVCIQNLIMTIGILVSGILAYFLYKTTSDLGKKQLELQKDITQKQIDLQESLAHQNSKMVLYQYRINCYLQIIQALYIIGFIDSELLGLIEKKTTNSDLIKKISEGRNLLLKSYRESELLFDNNISKYIFNIFDTYCNMQQSLELLFLTNFFNELEIKFNEFTAQEQIKDEYSPLKTYKVFINSVNDEPYWKEKYPDLKNHAEAYEKLKYYYNSNELSKMLLPYINVKDLGKDTNTIK